MVYVAYTQNNGWGVLIIKMWKVQYAFHVLLDVRRCLHASTATGSVDP